LVESKFADAEIQAALAQEEELRTQLQATKSNALPGTEDTEYDDDEQPRPQAAPSSVDDAQSL
jgi:hypothetical protein